MTDDKTTRTERVSLIKPSTPIAGLPILMTESDVAAFCQVTPRTVRNWLMDGVLKATSHGRSVRIHRSDVLLMWGLSEPVPCATISEEK